MSKLQTRFFAKQRPRGICTAQPGHAPSYNDVERSSVLFQTSPVGQGRRDACGTIAGMGDIQENCIFPPPVLYVHWRPEANGRKRLARSDGNDAKRSGKTAEETAEQLLPIKTQPHTRLFCR